MSTTPKPLFSPSTSGWYFADKHGASMPQDCVEVPFATYSRLLSYGGAIEPGPDGQPREKVIPVTPEVFQRLVGAAVDEMLDELARSWRYQNSTRLLAAKGSSNAKFSAEGTAFEAYWAACWTVLDDLEAAVMAGTAQMPSTVAEVLALLPAAPSRPT